MTKDELITKLEAAECGSQKLTVLALEALGYTQRTDSFMDAAGSRDHHWEWHTPEGKFFCEIGKEPPFTTSRDAMIPGVPEGYWTIHQRIGIASKGWQPWSAQLMVPAVMVHEFPWSAQFYEGNARTEPLARCIAQLRALPDAA